MIHFGPKESIIGTKKGHFRQSVPENGPLSSRTGTYRKTEGIQSYLRTWGSYDPIELDPSEPKKWGLYGRSVKNAHFRAKNGPRRPPRGPPCDAVNTKKLSFWYPAMMASKNLDDVSKKLISGQKTAFSAKKSAFFYATPI